MICTACKGKGGSPEYGPCTDCYGYGFTLEPMLCPKCNHELTIKWSGVECKHCGYTFCY